MQQQSYLEKMFGLGGRRILVLGGRGTIGEPTVRALASAGAEVIPTSRDPGTVATEVEMLRAMGHTCPFGLVVDILNRDSLAEAAARYREMSPDRPLDGMISNAGGNHGPAIIKPGASFFGLDPVECDKAMALNYTGARDAIMKLGPLLLGGDQPVITVVGSVSPWLSRVIDYGSAKAALERLVRGLAPHLAKEETPIRINGIQVGFIFGEGDGQNSFAKKDPVRYNAILRSIALGRTLTPEEIGAAMIYAQSRFCGVNGKLIPVDSGFGCNILGADAL